MQDVLAGCDLPLYLAERRGVVVGMHEIEERPRQHFLGAPAQRRRERGADTLEVAVHTGNAQHVERECEKTAELILCLLALRDVAHDTGEMAFAV